MTEAGAMGKSSPSTRNRGVGELGARGLCIVY
jgi:hypothetical protein